MAGVFICAVGLVAPLGDEEVTEGTRVAGRHAKLTNKLDCSRVGQLTCLCGMPHRECEDSDQR